MAASGNGGVGECGEEGEDAGEEGEEGDEACGKSVDCVVGMVDMVGRMDGVRVVGVVEWDLPNGKAN